jgi:hypothetical protein
VVEDVDWDELYPVWWRVKGEVICTVKGDFTKICQVLYVDGDLSKFESSVMKRMVKHVKGSQKVISSRKNVILSHLWKAMKKAFLWAFFDFQNACK